VLVELFHSQREALAISPCSHVKAPSKPPQRATDRHDPSCFYTTLYKYLQDSGSLKGETVTYAPKIISASLVNQANVQLDLSHHWIIACLVCNTTSVSLACKSHKRIQ
jgi:hypothetical protein